MFSIIDVPHDLSMCVMVCCRMEEQHSLKSQRFKPLERDQIRPFDRAAQEMGNNLTELTARVLLHTGFRNGEFCHSRSSFLSKERIMGKPVVRIPHRQDCIGGVGSVGKGNSDGESLHDRGQPCYKCRANRDGYWEPKTKNSPRTVPVMEEEVYELLVDWFANHEQIPMLHGAVATRVKRVGKEADIDREVKPHDLRHTYGTMLARMGFDAHSIAEAMGHGSINMPKNYISFTGEDLMNKFQENWDFDQFD